MIHPLETIRRYCARPRPLRGVRSVTLALVLCAVVLTPAGARSSVTPDESAEAQPGPRAVPPPATPMALGRVQAAFFRQNASEPLPPPTRFLRYVKIQSQLLSRFFGRPVYLRAGVLLPHDWYQEPGADARRYPLWVRMGGFGTRYTFVRDSDDVPESEPGILSMWLDGTGPYGDTSQVNSDNNGPVGDAVTKELIPYVEQQFRGIGKPYARFLSGPSTGGWGSLALQIFYPDFFNGAYAFWPDPVDFRALETINIYSDTNAFFDPHGVLRAEARDRSGRTTHTLKQECIDEANEGSGYWTQSGWQWGAWNAIYSPRGADGRPAPLWDATTGAIDHAVAAHWARYDLRRILEENWSTLGPKLHGKLNIWVGEQDPYFLNDSVHLLAHFLARANPPFTGRLVFVPGGGHGGFHAIGSQQMVREMEAAVAKAEGKAAPATGTAH